MAEQKDTSAAPDALRRQLDTIEQRARATLIKAGLLPDVAAVGSEDRRFPAYIAAVAPSELPRRRRRKSVDQMSPAMEAALTLTLVRQARRALEAGDHVAAALASTQAALFVAADNARVGEKLAHKRQRVNAARGSDAQRRHQDWQQRANDIWKRHPGWSKRAVVIQMNKDKAFPGFDPRTVSNCIHRPSRAKPTP